MTRKPWHGPAVSPPPAWLKLDAYDNGTRTWTPHQWVNAVRQRVFWSIYKPLAGLEQIKADPLYIADRENDPPVRPLTLGDVLDAAPAPYFDAAARLHAELHKHKGLSLYGAREGVSPELAARYPTKFAHAYLAIDTRAPVKELREGFEAWLAQTRKELAATGKLDTGQWHQHRVLAYSDLTLWQRIEASDTSEATIAHWLAHADTENPVSWLQRTVKPLHKKVFQSNPVWM